MNSLIHTGKVTTDTHYIKGLFLLILTVMGNFLGETMGCQIQRMLSRNMVVKQFVLLCLIYFTISFTGSFGENPYEVLQKSFFLWIFFVMFTRTNIWFASITFILLAVLYVLETFITYHTKEKDGKERVVMLETYKARLMYVTIGITILGFLLYLYKQYNEHRNFNILTFVFGKSVCSRM